MPGQPGGLTIRRIFFRAGRYAIHWRQSITYFEQNTGSAAVPLWYYRAVGRSDERSIRSLTSPASMPGNLWRRWTGLPLALIERFRMRRLDRRATGAAQALRHLPDGRGRAAASCLRWHPRADQWLARATFSSSVRTTRIPSRASALNAGDVGEVCSEAAQTPLQTAGTAGLTALRH